MGFPLAEENNSKSAQYLQMLNDRLEWVSEEDKGSYRLFTEFLKGPLGYRRLHGGGLKQAIAKAVGLKGGHAPLSVLDVTAGLGQDAFILASLGCRMHLLERSPIIAALLLDGLRRAAKDPGLCWMIESMQVTICDARSFLRGLPKTNIPEVIYIDPMFPERPKKALSKIEMRILKEVVGRDEDADFLLQEALLKAKKRVVVKRPIRAIPLLNKAPNFVVSGKSNRYDVYLTGG
jgi:16S rRNA (guanine1516-N2)-methyltransferase